MKTKSDIWIKVLSLGVGLAVGIVLIAKVFFELSYDSFYKDIDRVLKLSAVMAVIACIGALFVAHKWLEQFAEKVSLNPLYFIGGAVLVLLIVLGVVVLNCLKIARANPVESLKNE